jgi:glycosyltransferase involved in cell wall biosynthesis
LSAQEAMNILVIHEVDWKKKVVYEVHEFPELLARRGHNVTFIDYEESYSRSSWADLVRWSTRVVKDAHRVFSDTAIEVRTPGLVKLPVIDRLSSTLFQFIEISRTIQEKKIDIVYLYSMPTSGIGAVCAAQNAGVPVVFRSIDVLHGLRGLPVSAGIYLAERYVYPRVNRILALTPTMKEYVCGLGADPRRVEVLRPGIDAASFKPAPKDPELMAKYGLKPSDKVAMFLGTMYDFAGIDYVVANFRRVVDAVPDARLLLVGGGHSLNDFRRIAKENGVEREVAFTDFATIDMLPRFINCSDITFNSFRHNKLTDAVFPEKLPRYLACGKPLITTPLKAVIGILRGEEDGVLFRKLDTEFMDGMIELFKDPERSARLGRNALRYTQVNHDWERVIDRLEQVFRREIAHKRPPVVHAPLAPAGDRS